MLRSHPPKIIILIKHWKLIIFFFFLSILHTYIIINSGNQLGIQDWDQHLAYHESSRVSVLEYHQFPWWNPYHCGGMPQFANPQIAIISPTFLFVLAFGTLWGIKISIVLHYFLGLVGFYLFCRQLHLQRWSSILAAEVFVFGGIVSSSIGSGMMPFLYIFYIPFTFYFYLRSLSQNKNKYFWVILSGLSLALNFYSGYHIPLLTIPFLIILSLLLSFKTKKLFPFLSLLMVLFTYIILASPKLILSIELIRRFPRVIGDQSGYQTLSSFLYFLIMPRQGLGTISGNWFNFGTDENSQFIGLIPLLLGITGLATHYKKRWEYLALTIIAGWLTFGSFIHPSLWELIRQLPYLNFFRVAQRFRYEFIFFFCLFIGWGAEWIVKYAKPFKYLPQLLICYVFFSLTLFSSFNFFIQMFSLKTNPENLNNKPLEFTLQNNIVNQYQPIQGSLGERPYYEVTSNEYLALKNNVGIIDCYEPIPNYRRALPTTDRTKIIFSLIQTAPPLKYTWTPNQVTVWPDIIGEPIILNQNFDPLWRVKVGEQDFPTQELNGLISYTPLENTPFEFYYSPLSSLFKK